MTSHDPFEKLLPLYLYGELDDPDSAELEGHLAACGECAKQLSELRVLHGHLDKKASLEPTEDALRQMRSQLRERLRVESRLSIRKSLWQRVATYWQTRSLGLQMAVATAVLLIGILAGRITAPDPWSKFTQNIEMGLGYQPIIDEQQSFIDNIDLIEYEPATGSVTIKYKSVNDVWLQGKIDDASVRKLLAHAIKTEVHPGRRLAAVKAFGGQSFSDKEVENALVFALENDSVHGVRLKAAKVLSMLPMTPEIKAAFIRVLLKDPNPALRMEAVDALSKLKEEEDVVPVFQEASNDDENEFIRLRTSKELERRINPQFDQNGLER
ncbi:HEAT repeat domain-containing protein [bacterium]|nr:HEAT repeat domain-containing protein [bacterium]